jgi:ABC-type proline/glycine betaine transport system ATPase subunit
MSFSGVQRGLAQFEVNAPAKDWCDRFFSRLLEILVMKSHIIMLSTKSAELADYTRHF